MANSKATGVAYADPQFESIDVQGDAVIGGASTDLVGFHGSSGADQAATIASVTQPAFSIGGYGLTGTAGLTSLWAAVNAITAALREKGLIASS